MTLNKLASLPHPQHEGVVWARNSVDAGRAGQALASLVRIGQDSLSLGPRGAFWRMASPTPTTDEPYAYAMEGGWMGWYFGDHTAVLLARHTAQPWPLRFDPRLDPAERLAGFEAARAALQPWSGRIAMRATDLEQATAAFWCPIQPNPEIQDQAAALLRAIWTVLTDCPDLMSRSASKHRWAQLELKSASLFEGRLRAPEIRIDGFGQVAHPALEWSQDLDKSLWNSKISKTDLIAQQFGKNYQSKDSLAQMEAVVLARMDLKDRDFAPPSKHAILRARTDLMRLGLNLI